MIVTLGAWAHVDLREPKTVLVDARRFVPEQPLSKAGAFFVLPIGHTRFIRRSEEDRGRIEETVTLSLTAPSTLQIAWGVHVTSFFMPEFDAEHAPTVEEPVRRSVWSVLTDEDDAFESPPRRLPLKVLEWSPLSLRQRLVKHARKTVRAAIKLVGK